MIVYVGGSVEAQLSLDPEEFRGAELDQIRDAIRDALDANVRNVDWDEYEIEDAAERILDALKEN